MTKRLSPIGRIVQGNPLTGNPQVDDRTKQPKLAKDGSQLINWYMNVAFSKQDPDTLAMIGEIYAEAARAFPQLFPNGVNFQAANFGCVRADFATKLIDGDTLDPNGKPHANKAGFAGHWIVKISTYAGAMRVVNGLQNNAPITEVGSGPNHIKTGDFVRVALDFKTNGWADDAQSKPGLYMNPDLVQLAGYGDAIVGGPDADEVFKNAAAYIPAGMSTSPTSPSAMPGLPAPLQPAGSAGTLPGLPATPALPAVAAAPQYVLSPEAAAQGLTKAALNAQGHTDDVLIANGYLVLAPTPAAAPALPSLTPALPVIAAAPALPVIPNHGVVAAVLAAPQYNVAPAVAAQGHTLASLQAAGHTIDALLAAQYINRT